MIFDTQKTIRDIVFQTCIQVRQKTLEEVADKLIKIEKDKWEDAEHCTCLGYAIVSVFGEKYEKILQNLKSKKEKI